MKNFLIAFSVCLVWSFFALWLYSWLLPKNIDSGIVADISSPDVVIDTPPFSEVLNKDNLPQTINKDTETAPTTINNTIKEDLIEAEVIQGLTASYGEDNIIFQYNDGISFTKNTRILSIPKSVKGFISKITTYLSEHPNTEIHIISSYSAIEVFETPNIGLQRGNEIKKLLSSQGVDTTRIIVQSSIEEIHFSIENKYSNAISFVFKPLNKKPKALLVTKTSTQPKSITFYPKISKSSILKSKQLEALVLRVKKILLQYPKTTLTLIGHTDNAGNVDENHSVGLKYAKELRWYLITKGSIDEKRIKIASKGESQPIQSNRTEKGSMANRRVVLKFK